MGCVQSSSDERKDKASSRGGGVIGGAADGNNAAGPGASNAVLDPRLPLNARQKYSMVASWKGIARALEPTGIYMFIKFVSSSPPPFCLPRAYYFDNLSTTLNANTERKSERESESRRGPPLSVASGLPGVDST